MYNSYFGFSASPFENTLNQHFLFLSDNHKEVLAALQYFIKEKKGMALVCGDVGTGKTMLIHTLMTLLPDWVHPLAIPNPYVSYLELIQFIARALGVTSNSGNILELIDQIKQTLVAARENGQAYLLIIDEAQLLSDENMEQIRLLSNIEIPEGKLLQILLVGQYEVSRRLERHNLRHLRQRININRFLFPMDQATTLAYMDHRLHAVGSSFEACFTEDCPRTVHQLSGGVPRLINNLCDNALLICMTEGLKKVNPQILKKAWEALQTDIICAPQTAPAPRRGGVFWLSAAAACLASLLLGFFLGQSNVIGQVVKGFSVAEKRQPATQDKTFPFLLSKQPIFSQKSGSKTPLFEDLVFTESLKGAVSTEPPSQGKSAAGAAPEKPSRRESGAALPAQGSGQGLSLTQPAASPSPKTERVPQTAATPLPQETRETTVASSQIYRGTVPPKSSEMETPKAPPQEQPGAKPASPPEVAPLVQEPAKPVKAASQASEPLPSEKQASEHPLPGKIVEKPRIHRISSQDGNLTRIVSKYYPGNKDVALAAVILANPQLVSVDRIFAGQELILPWINPTNQVITLPDGKYYVVYEQDLSASSQQTASNFLKERQVRFVLRESQEMGAKVYRIYLGGYEQEADLQKAIALVKRK